ncbi:MAG: hypothetical protein M1830_002508 [Pleopsidium flavum]|nr:MAG: hypothetical protein M1830_002508 [Pleopsidium flavum]
MTFLLARRDKSKELSKPAGEKKRREKDKATDAEEEISRFFTSRKHPLTEIDPNLLRKQPSAFTTPSHMARGRGKSTLPEASASRQSSKPPFELPDKPFLGFGNRGAPPISPLKNLDPVSKTTPSAAPSEMGHALSKRSSTYFTGSSNGIRSEVPDRKRLKNTAPLLGSPEVSVSFNQAMPSIEVGQLGQTGLHKMRPPDKQPQLLHKQPPGRRSLLIEGLDRLHSSNGSQSRQSSLALSAHGPQEAVETWNNREKPVKLIENDGDDPSQPLVETAELRTKSKTQDDKPRPSKSQDTLSHSGKRKDQLQSLSSLLRDCEATLSNLISTECDPSALQQGKRSDKSRSRSANARNNLRSRPEEVFTDCNAEEPEPLSDGLSTTTPRRSYKSPTKEFCPTIVGNQSFRRDQGGLSRVQLNADHLPPPAHQADQGHLQSQVPTYNATVLFRNTGDIEGYVHHNTEDPADLAIRDTQPQSPGAYYVADPRQYARNHYLFEAPGEDGSTGDGEVGNLRHPIRFDEWDPRNTPHDFENSQLDNIYKNSPVSLQDLGISSENLKDHCGVDSFPGREVDHVNTYLDVNMDRQGNGYPFVSASDHEEDHSLWVNEYAEGLPETVLPVNVLNDDLLGTCDRHTRRAESRAGHSMEIDEMPMTKFWRPHRLY